MTGWVQVDAGDLTRIARIAVGVGPAWGHPGERIPAAAGPVPIHVTAYGLVLPVWGELRLEAHVAAGHVTTIRLLPWGEPNPTVGEEEEAPTATA